MEDNQINQNPEEITVKSQQIKIEKGKTENIEEAKKKMNSPILLILVLILVSMGIGGYGVYYFISQGNSIVPAKFCQSDAKICPDGSSVGRTGPKCEFAPCSSPSSTSINSEIVNETDSWKTYTNDEYGFEFKYPNKSVLNIHESRNKDISLLLTNLDDNKNRECLGFCEEIVIDLSDKNNKKSNLYIDIEKEINSLKSINIGEEIKDQWGNRIREKNFIIDKLEAVSFYYKIPYEGYPNLKIYFLKNNYAFMATYYYKNYSDSETKDIISYDEFKQILSTFKFINKKNNEEISNWKTYRNDEFGFEFRHPIGINIEKNNTQDQNVILNLNIANNSTIFGNFNLINTTLNTSQYVDELNSKFDNDPKIEINTRKLILNNLDVLEVNVSGMDVDRFYIFNYGDKLYKFDLIMMAIPSPDDVETYSDLLKKIISTFKITN